MLGRQTRLGEHRGVLFWALRIDNVTETTRSCNGKQRATVTTLTDPPRAPKLSNTPARPSHSPPRRRALRTRRRGGMSNEWSETRKWVMSLTEKVLTAIVALLFTLLFADRYRAAEMEQRQRQETIGKRLESLSESTLNFSASLYDSYLTPCGKNGRARVQKLRDEHYFAFVNAVESVERTTHLFTSSTNGRDARKQIDTFRKQSDELYKQYVVPRLQCGCAAQAAEVEDRVGPPEGCPMARTEFATAFGRLMKTRRDLLRTVTDEYCHQSSRSMLALFGWAIGISSI